MGLYVKCLHLSSDDRPGSPQKGRLRCVPARLMLGIDIIGRSICSNSAFARCSTGDCLARVAPNRVVTCPPEPAAPVNSLDIASILARTALSMLLSTRVSNGPGNTAERLALMHRTLYFCWLKRGLRREDDTPTAGTGDVRETALSIPVKQLQVCMSIPSQQPRWPLVANRSSETFPGLLIHSLCQPISRFSVMCSDQSFRAPSSVCTGNQEH